MADYGDLEAPELYCGVVTPTVEGYDSMRRAYSFKMYKSMTLNQLMAELVKARTVLGGDIPVWVKGFDDVRLDAYMISVRAG